MSEQDPFGNSGRDYGATGPTAVPAVGFADFSPTEFYQLCDQIDTNISSIHSGIRSLSKTCKLIGTPKDNQKLRAKLHSSQQSLKTTVSVTTSDIQRLCVVVRYGDKKQKLQVERLREAFIDTINKYPSVQKEVSTKQREHELLPQSRSSQLMDLSSGNMDDDEQALLVAEQQAQVRQIQFDTTLQLEREIYMRRIEEDVLDVNQIMTQLATLVHEQGRAVDTIETTIDNATGNVEEGTAELVKAAVYQNKARRKIVIIAVIALIIAIILIVVIVNSVRR